MSEIKPKAEDVARLICLTCWRDGDISAIVASPTVNDKRPYGNSNILDDIHTIIGTVSDDVDEDGMVIYSKKQDAYALACHNALCNAISSICSPKHLEFITNNINLDYDRYSKEESEDRYQLWEVINND